MIHRCICDCVGLFLRRESELRPVLYTPCRSYEPHHTPRHHDTTCAKKKPRFVLTPCMYALATSDTRACCHACCTGPDVQSRSSGVASAGGVLVGPFRLRCASSSGGEAAEAATATNSASTDSDLGIKIGEGCVKRLQVSLAQSCFCFCHAHEHTHTPYTYTYIYTYTHNYSLKVVMHPSAGDQPQAQRSRRAREDSSSHG